MKSMTGFACREKTGEEITVSVELRGVNSRFLEIYVNLPPRLQALETKAREYIASRFGRGKIEADIRIKEHNAKISVGINEEAARAYHEAISRMARSLGIKEKPNLSLVLGMEGVLETGKSRDTEKYWKEIEEVLIGAADVFEAEKTREGKHTEADILSHISLIEESVKTIAAYAPQIEESIKENLRSRFAELMGDKIDENRVLAETAVLLMKYTISEEISRLSSHLTEFRAETGRNTSPGKKLDFLCQEINREINTIGSKTPLLEVSRAVVEMKDALENVREQLRNVE
ncbi:MAG: YicC family protein [Treponema sp.]|jgi:uncharacterized protein (TIGR00255 family)|nr:YicC family protein [Treponema sp.]